MFGGVRALVLVILTSVAVTACTSTSPELIAAPPASTLLAPDDFAEEILKGDRFVLNVHIPDEGSIRGTDADIPFDALAQNTDRLPDIGTPLAVYCRSGSMSATAVVELKDIGYPDIVELDGGMVEWEASGRPLVD